jgi:hypothetical protein
VYSIEIKCGKDNVFVYAEIVGVIANHVTKEVNFCLSKDITFYDPIEEKLCALICISTAPNAQSRLITNNGDFAVVSFESLSEIKYKSFLDTLISVRF